MLNNTTFSLVWDQMEPTNISSRGNQVCPLLKQVRQHTDITRASFRAGCLFLAFVNGIFSTTSIFCNAVILSAFCRIGSLRSPSNMVLFGLSCCDFFVGMITQPLLTTELALFAVDASVACTLKDLYVIFLFAFSFSSLVHICLTCVERFFAIFCPFRHERLLTKTKIGVALAFFWISWILLTAFTRREHGGSIIGFSRVAFIIFSALIVIVINLNLWGEARRHTRRLHVAPTHEEILQRTREVAAKVHQTRATRTVLSIIGWLVICNLPLVSTFIARKFLNVRGRLVTLFWFGANTVVLLPASINPVIFFWRRRDIRAAIRRKFFRCNRQF